MKTFLLIQGLILIGAASISDIKTYKIKNSIILTFLTLGILSNTLASGIQGLLSSLKGISIPFACLFLLFALRMLGAGDIKLLSALGAIFGYPLIISIMLYSFISGGIIAIVLIITRKNALQRIVYILDYIKQCIMLSSILPYTNFNDKSDKAKFHFSIAILLGTLITLIL